MPKHFPKLLILVALGAVAPASAQQPGAGTEKVCAQSARVAVSLFEANRSTAGLLP